MKPRDELIRALSAEHGIALDLAIDLAMFAETVVAVMRRAVVDKERRDAASCTLCAWMLGTLEVNGWGGCPLCRS